MGYNAFMKDPFGAKRTMMLVNIPIAIGWIILNNANNVWQLFVANILLGLSLGLMVSPVVRYVGEIW